MKPRIKKFPLLWQCSDGDFTAVALTAREAYLIWKSIKDHKHKAVAYVC